MECLGAIIYYRRSNIVNSDSPRAIIHYRRCNIVHSYRVDGVTPYIYTVDRLDLFNLPMPYTKDAVI